MLEFGVIEFIWRLEQAYNPQSYFNSSADRAKWVKIVGNESLHPKSLFSVSFASF